MRNAAEHRTYTVGELARLSGVSIRTLHHYDAIGLLKPAVVGENGYRLYGREELLRLQQILFHRELGMSLAGIADALDSPGFDRLSALRRQREKVVQGADRLRQLLRTIDRTIADLEGEQTMSDGDLYKGFEPDKQARYEAFIIEKYGERGRAGVESGKRRMAAMTERDLRVHMDELAGIEGDMAAGVRAGVAPDDSVLDPLMRRHHAWVAVAWDEAPSAEAYAGLGELYAGHPDFIARYESLEPGLAAWLRTAMAAFAGRNLA